MRHLDLLAAGFGEWHVPGGQFLISATLDRDRMVLHLTDLHTLAYGSATARGRRAWVFIAADVATTLQAERAAIATREGFPPATHR
jgi:hypothetical protein